MLCVVLLGTVVKDTSVSKAAKSIYTMTDSEKDSPADDDAADGKECSGKESADIFHSSCTVFIFCSGIYQTLFSSVAVYSRTIDDPCVESASLPPEARA